MIENVNWAANQHITMISKRSWDTEDSSNDAESLAFITGINYILKCIQIENSYFKLIFNITTVLLYSWSNNWNICKHKRLSIALYSVRINSK